MIVDMILDRKDNEEFYGQDIYEPKKFYLDLLGRVCSEPITLAMDYGDESDVKRELCNYIDEQEYNPEIKNYINSKKWL